MQYLYTRYNTREKRLESAEYGTFQCHVGYLRRLEWPSLSIADHINLYNLMVRHGLLEYPSWSESSWQSMLGVIQYELNNGMIVSLADLSSKLLPKAKPKGWKKAIFWKKRNNSSSSISTKHHHVSFGDEKDPRIPFCIRCVSARAFCLFVST